MFGDSSILDACANDRLPSYQVIPRVTRAVLKGGHTVVGRHSTAIKNTNAMDSATVEKILCMWICTIRLIQLVGLRDQAAKL